MTWEDGITPDAVLAKFHGHAFSKSEYASFRYTIASVISPDPGCVYWRDADDIASSSFLDHCLCCMLAAQEKAFKANV